MFNQKCILKSGRPVRIFFIAIICIFSVCVHAAPVDSFKAEKAVKGWLKMDRKPLGASLSDEIASVDTYTEQTGGTQYIVVNLKPEGYVVVSADDELDPIIAFSPKGAFDPSLSAPLGLLVHKDTLAQKERLKRAIKKTQGEKTKKEKKWDQLIATADHTYTVSYGLSGITDLRVSPLVQSEWGQTHVGTGTTNYCYNYYTPNHYPSGCVATAMAQLMRYHQYPTAGIGLHTETVYVDGAPVDLTTRGGNGSGGAYSWSNMPLVPIDATNTQRSAIGALCYDAGVTVGMDYTESGSGAFLYYSQYATDADRALVDIFGFSNCIGFYGTNGIAGSTLKTMMNPNLDAGLPVILGIYDSENPTSSGHAILADGYGYDNQTLYHHLNMGWQGHADVWYALPVIDTGSIGYYSDVVDECLYNIYTSGTGEIISGRVTDTAAVPLEGILVKAMQGETVIAQDTTDAKGIYALTNLPSNQACIIVVEQNGQMLASLEKEPGHSQDGSVQTGNIGEVDFAGVETAAPPTASDIDVEIFDPNEVTIELLAVDDGTPEALSYIITSLPEHGWLFDPYDSSEIVATPYTLQNDANSVIYEPCPYYFTGTDGFTFKANDGGDAPDGGDSNVAVVNLVMNMLSDTVYQVHTIYKDYIPFMTGYKKGRSQALYHADELGSRAQVIANLALNIETAPAIEIQNLKIRMKHTTLTEYPSGAVFDNTGWTVVYDANETITETGWHEFNLQSTFAYDGINNLMIDFSFDNSSTNTGYGYVYDSATGTQNRIISYWSNTGDPLEFVTPNVKWKRLFNLTLKTQPDTEVLFADFNYNCSVGSEDLMTMIDAWLAQEGDADYNSGCDISIQVDKKVNLADFAVLASEWLLTME
jgi:hypothetical protein